ncbi:hypothetical protein FACS1894161_3470 [Spirochaetia bacterium]|nr:hypothetical protein FACS1894161_3470 [Spirochaetia bacterium]
MVRLRVKEFGPLTTGYNRGDGWLDIRRVTFFCGPQGSGKSTLAKLVSAFSWIEKALMRGDFTTKDLIFDVLQNERFEYLGIGAYLRKETEIEFEGQAYSFCVKKQKLITKKSGDRHYIRPKIMYVPAERNLLTTANEQSVKTYKGLPKPLYTLLEEYEKAKPAIKKIALPIGDTVFFYDENKGTSFLTKSDGTYPIPVSEGASGYQSVLPLILVSRFLAEPKRFDVSSSVQPLDYNVKNRIKSEIKTMLPTHGIELQLPSTMETNEFKAVLEAAGINYSFGQDNVLTLNKGPHKDIINFLAGFYNQSFLNIVEEPEQNLYPASQREVLFDLFSCVNKNENNQLIVTTHSPYMIYYLTLAIKAFELLKAGVPVKKLKGIIAYDAAINGADTVLYELSKKGEIRKLPAYKNMPSDENILNKEIIKGNSDFNKLLRINLQ